MAIEGVRVRYEIVPGSDPVQVGTFFDKYVPGVGWVADGAGFSGAVGPAKAALETELDVKYPDNIGPPP